MNMMMRRLARSPIVVSIMRAQNGALPSCCWRCACVVLRCLLRYQLLYG
jgi:hypothetical protein